MPRRIGRPRRCLLAAALALSLAACSSPEQRFAAHVERAERLVAEGRVADAILEYRSAIDLRPDDAELNQRVGDLFARQRSTLEAVSYYRRAFQLDPQRIDAAMAEARLLAFEDPARAKELVAIGLERAPDRALVQQTRSHVALAANDVDEALRAAQRAVELEPRSLDAWLDVGKVHQARIRQHQIGKTIAPAEVFQAALDAYARASEIAPDDVRPRVERARVLAVWPGHVEQALAAHREALEVARRSRDAYARVLAGKALDDFGRSQRSSALRREGLREVVAADEDDYESWDRLANLADDQPVPQGEAVCRELLAKRPEDPLAHRVYVSYLMTKQRPADAIAHLKQTIDGGVQSPMLLDQLVSIQTRTRPVAEARATWLELADAFPDDPLTKTSEARVALAEGRPADAAKILRELVKTSDTAENQRLLAIAEERTGNLAGAVAAVDRAAELAPESVELYRLMARIHHDAGQWRKVIFDYRVLAGRGHPLLASDELRRARALYEVGRPENGRRALADLLRRPNPSPAVAIEYARREGAASFDTASNALLAALARSPGDPRLLESLVQLELRTGRAKSALARLDAEVDAGRARPRILLLRAQVLAAGGELERAEADVLRAFEAAPKLPGAVELLFEIYRRQNRLAEAQKSFEQADSAGVLHPGARLLLGRLYLSQGQLDKAQATLEKVVVEAPDLASARNDLAFVLAERGEQLPRALELARSAEQALPGNPAVVDTVGYVQFKSGQLEAALGELNRAIALAEARPEGVAPAYPYHLGLVLQALGRKDEAAAAFRRALAGPGDFPEAEDARRRLESVLANSPAGANAS
jgi:tetratricopeptide (TPR) repeat protein